MNTYGDHRGVLDFTLPLPPPPPRVLSSATSASQSSMEQITGVCYSPKLLLSRWLHRQRRGSSGGGDHEVEEGVVGCRVRFPRPPCNKNRKKKNSRRYKREEGGDHHRVVPPSPESFTSNKGRKPEDGMMSLNVGLSVALAFLLARGGTEINKISDMRMQMELLLTDIKNELMQRTNAVSSFTESNNLSNSSSSAYQNETSQHRESVSVQKCRASFKMELVGNSRCLKMDQMEAELEVELERLQLHVEERRRSSSAIAKHQLTEMESKSSSSYDEESSNVSHAEETIISEEYAKQEDMSKFCGVSPIELERRLHELLEAQQQERIQELEYALERTERKIREIDVELRWWRDAAKLASKHNDIALLR